MRLLQDLRIGTRLGAAFTLVLALAAFIGGLAVLQLHRVDGMSREIADNWLPSVRVTGAMLKTVGDFRRQQFQHLLSEEPAAMQRYEKRMDEEVARFAKQRADYEKLISSPEEKAIWDRFMVSWADFLKDHESLLALSRAQRKAEGTAALRGRSGELVKAAEAELQKLADLNAEGGDAASQLADTIYHSARAWLLATLALALALGVAAAVAITRSLTQPIAESVRVARAVAGGDLTTRIEVSRKDEMGELLSALQAMSANLARIVGQVRHSSDSIATGSAQIATGNADLSQRTEEQASNLQQTAASMEEMTSTVQRNAETARTATQLSSSASVAAVRGGEVVGQVVATMNGISASSSRIADIVGTIDGIAFQTNILALNAAVEAARAGEQGRGFAVVAGEVRSLAQRSAEAAREIKTLIGQNVQRVEAGSRLAGDAGASMDDIVAQVKRVADLIAEIGAASHEQTQGIGQVGHAVAQLDQVTQQNAALVEESAAAAESLRVQAATLNELVGVFNIGSGGAGAAQAAIAKARTGSRALPAGVPKKAAAAAAPAAQPKAAAVDKADGGGSWETF